MKKNRFGPVAGLFKRKALKRRNPNSMKAPDAVSESPCQQRRRERKEQAAK